MSHDTVRSLLSPSHQGPALIPTTGPAIDHATLRATVDRLAAQLRDYGFRRNDRIAISLSNGPEMALVLLAVMSSSCAAPLNPKYQEDEFRFYLEHLGAAAIITTEGTTAAGLGLATIEVSGTGAAVELSASPIREADPAEGPPTGDDQALVLHTSGTTSRPKIVPLHHRKLARSAGNIAGCLGLTAGDRSLTVMPLFHIHGIMAGLLAPLSAGASVICPPGFDAFKFHSWIHDLRPTYYSAVPTMHQLVLARAPEPRPTSLRFVRSSSASLPGHVYDGLQELFDVPVIEAYGMTEACHQMTSNPLPPGKPKLGSVGLPVGIQVAVLDGENAVLAPGHRGEVAIRGDTVFDGYENEPGANESSFTAGWFRTGDEGVIDDEGYLFLTGRLKELINRGGEKVSPLEVEDALLRHPQVSEAVAFAVPHDRLGEEVGAAVVLAPGADVTEQQLRTYVGNALAAFKVPRRILFLDAIPKGSTGKLQRIGMASRLDL